MQKVPNWLWVLLTWQVSLFRIFGVSALVSPIIAIHGFSVRSHAMRIAHYVPVSRVSTTSMLSVRYLRVSHDITGYDSYHIPSQRTVKDLSRNKRRGRMYTTRRWKTLCLSSSSSSVRSRAGPILPAALQAVTDSDGQESNPPTFESKNQNEDYRVVNHEDSSKQPQSLPIPLPFHHSAIKTRNITTSIQFYSLLGFDVAVKFRAGPARAAWLEQRPSPQHQQQQQHHQDQSEDQMPQPSSPDAVKGRIELIEVPSYLLNEPEGMKRRAFDLMDRQDLLGHNHLALDVTWSASQLLQERKRQRLLQQNDTPEQTTELNQNSVTSSLKGEDDVVKEELTTIKTPNDLEMNVTISPTEREVDRISLQDWMDELNRKSVEIFGKTLRVALEPRQQIIGRTVYELAFIYDADGSLIELVLKGRELPQNVSSGWTPILEDNAKDFWTD